LADHTGAIQTASMLSPCLNLVRHILIQPRSAKAWRALLTIAAIAFLQVETSWAAQSLFQQALQRFDRLTKKCHQRAASPEWEICSEIINTSFSGRELRLLEAYGLRLKQVQLHTITMDRVDNSYQLWSAVKISQSRIDGSVFMRTQFHDVEFQDLKIRHSKFMFAQFKNCRFQDVELERVSLRGANFESCEFINTTCIDCMVDESTWPQAIRNSKGEIQLLDRSGKTQRAARSKVPSEDPSGDEL